MTNSPVSIAPPTGLPKVRKVVLSSAEEKSILRFSKVASVRFAVTSRTRPASRIFTGVSPYWSDFNS